MGNAIPKRLSNAHLARLLSREADKAEGIMAKALRRAARSALLWPEEAAQLHETDLPLTGLHGIGPRLGRLIVSWLDTPPPVESATELEKEFFTLAEARRIVARHPQWLRELKGDLQMHTNWSDGSGTVEDMAKAAVERDYTYIGITDHTKGLSIANGLDERRLAQQGREITRLNKKLSARDIEFEVLRSAEVNLSPAGEVDMDPEALGTLDLVLGSFHSALRRKEDQTDRYLAALRNPSIQILGHPQCRVYAYRSGLHADWHRVFAEAAKLDKAVEIDGYADRQDLRVSLLKIAREEGPHISLGTDAHHPWQLAFMEFSLAAAIKAGIPRERIINFMSADKLRQWVSRLRTGRKSRPRRSLLAS